MKITVKKLTPVIQKVGDKESEYSHEKAYQFDSHMFIVV